LTLDRLSEETVEIIRRLGNATVNAILEHSVQVGVATPLAAHRC
jgi:hypothetical protein